MKRILIQQNDQLLTDICSDLSKFHKTFAQVKDAYSQLGIGDLNEDEFSKILSGDTSDIIASYRKSLDDQLENTLVKNSILKRIVLDGTEELIGNFQRACNNFLNTDTTPDKYGRHKDRQIFLKANDLSYYLGALCISNDSKDELLEKHCRLYVETENDHRVYVPLLKIRAALQEFRGALFDLGLPMELKDLIGGPGYLVNSHIDQFFTCGKDKQVKIKPESVKWAANYAVEYKRAMDMFNKR